MPTLDNPDRLSAGGGLLVADFLGDAGMRTTRDAEREAMNRTPKYDANGQPNARYRLTFEAVRVDKMYKYSNADPRQYANTTQTVPNSQIPDEDWHLVEGREGPIEQLVSQYHTLCTWAEADREFIRNVRLYKLKTEPEWVDVPTEETTRLRELAVAAEDARRKLASHSGTTYRLRGSANEYEVGEAGLPMIRARLTDIPMDQL